MPESSHTFLFSEEICTVPFTFGMFIMIMSFLCLGLALADNLIDGINPPVNVKLVVRVAQYMGKCSVIFMWLD